MATFSVVSSVSFRSLRHKSRAALQQRIREVSSILYPPPIVPEMDQMSRDALARHLLDLHKRLPE